MINSKIPIYGIIIIISFLINIPIIVKQTKKYNYNKTEITCLLLYENMGIIIGAKLFTYIINYPITKNQPLIKTNLSSLGGAIGALFMIILFSYQFKINKKELLKIFTPSAPLMYGIGKIGCFLTGCCHGIEYNGIGNITYKYSIVAKENIHYFPIQIIETIAFIIIFIIIMHLEKNNNKDFKIVGINILLCGTTKFLLDFLRESHQSQLLSPNQITCIPFIILGIIIIKQEKIKRSYLKI